MTKIISDDIVSDNEGVSIGSVGGYVSRFKEQEKKGGSSSLPSFNPKTSSSAKKDSPEPSLPSKLDSETEPAILIHFYKKFGNQDCDDFKQVSGKIAANMNRLYGAGLTPDSVNSKLEAHVNPSVLIPSDEEIRSQRKRETSSDRRLVLNEEAEKIEVDIKERSYKYIKNLAPLKKDQLDLVRFIDPSCLCFSSNGYSNFHLSLVPGKESSFDNLFKFSKKEEMMFLMFKEQLQDEHKAKKLVLMSRIIEDDSEPRKKTSRKKSTKRNSSKKTELPKDESV